MITLYTHEISGHSHRARLLLDILGLEYQIERVDLMAGEHKQPEFLTLNPFGQVPVLVDDEVVLSDSTAILVYLALRYDAQRQWLPRDPLQAARVQRWLSVASNEVVRGPGNARLVKLLGAGHDLEKAQQMAARLYTLLDQTLEQGQWLVGDSPTLADIAIYSYTAVAHEGGVDLAPYPNVLAWLERVRDINGFTEMTIQPREEAA